jgi:hypothetical protein
MRMSMRKITVGDAGLPRGGDPPDRHICECHIIKSGVKHKHTFERVVHCGFVVQK